MSQITSILLILSVLIAGLLSYYQYLYKATSKSNLNLFLTFLRFTSYLTVFVLLINPVISQKSLEIVKTPLPIFFDNSQSIKELNAQENIKSVYEALKDNKKLKTKFDVQIYLFDSEIHQDKPFDFIGKQTKLDDVAQNVKQLFKAPFIPVLIVTDGNQTQGRDYVYSFQSNVAVFPVIVGDTTQVEDLKNNQININKYAFLKNKFPVEIFVQYNGPKSIQADVIIYENGKPVFKEKISFSSKQKVKTITAFLNANTVGIKKYKATINSSLVEKNKTNNTKYFSLEILDQRKEIALISTITHPDLGVIKRSIESNELRKVKIVNPKEINDLSNFNACIFYQPNAEYLPLISKAKKLKINAFFITGNSTNYDVMNQSQSDLVFKMTNQKENYNASYNEQFNLFAQDNIGFDSFSPLENGFGSVQINANVSVLLGSKINRIDVNNPMLCFSENASFRKAYLLGENIWRWRIESYVKTNNFTQFDMFMDKIIQFLTSNSTNTSLVVSHESFYNSGEPIEIKAQFFNKNYEFDENALLRITLKNQANNSLKTFDFLKANTEYKVNLDNLVPGNYSFTVVEKNTKTSFSAAFEILDFEIEKQFVNADKKHLEQLAQNTNGIVFYPNTVDALIENLMDNKNYKSIQKEIIKKTPLIEWTWLMILLAITLATEWFVRKYNGLL
ncbi:hypothetical protein [uncultured Flavobacterium sp.]|uniref:hypothetical protein n=1 Tax=uncultured Flavobacterium sp. TaxID=165435 RepID=UPI0030CA570C